jgi:hypothetical protein
MNKILAGAITNIGMGNSVRLLPALPHLGSIGNIPQLIQDLSILAYERSITLGPLINDYPTNIDVMAASNSSISSNPLSSSKAIWVQAICQTCIERTWRSVTTNHENLHIPHIELGLADVEDDADMNINILDRMPGR